MEMLSRYACPVALALIAFLVGSVAAQGADETRTPCTGDAMIVFDASGSMAGNTVQGLFSDKTRIDEVRKALGEVLPGVTKFRKVGLITYGPDPTGNAMSIWPSPIPNAADRIMSVVNALNPAGKTPLTEAVRQAAEVLDYKTEKGVVVLVTDGEETCGGAPCDLGKFLKANSRALTVHVIGYQLTGFSWTGAESILDVQCLAEETGGLYISAKNRDDLVKAFEKTLGCPMMSAIGASLH
jgi:Ca-activated chloride channel homolog